VQTAPGAFELLEVLVVEDLVYLLAELGVDLRNERLDGVDDIG